MASVHPVPGSAVAPRTAPRVVATCETVPIAIGLNDERIRTVRSDNCADTLTINSNPHDNQHDSALYEDYIHVPTGRRAMIPLYIDPVTGRRTRFCEPPNGFTLVNASNDDQPAPASSSMLEKLLNIFRCSAPTDTQTDDRIAPPSAIVTSRTSMRQPVFDDPDDSDNTHQQGSFKLSTKAL